MYPKFVQAAHASTSNPNRARTALDPLRQFSPRRCETADEAVSMDILISINILNNSNDTSKPCQSTTYTVITRRIIRLKTIIKASLSIFQVATIKYIPSSFGLDTHPPQVPIVRSEQESPSTRCVKGPPNPRFIGWRRFWFLSWPRVSQAYCGWIHWGEQNLGNYVLQYRQIKYNRLGCSPVVGAV